jgi:hypothetical protein
MARLRDPEGFKPSGRSEAEIRANIQNIPLLTILSPSTSLELKTALKLMWWEEIALNQKDRDEEEAYQEDARRNVHR